MSDFRAFMDRLTVLLGGSIAGYRWKPFVIWPTENPRAFKYISEHTPPAYYRMGKKSG